MEVIFCPSSQQMARQKQKLEELYEQIKGDYDKLLSHVQVSHSFD